MTGSAPNHWIKPYVQNAIELNSRLCKNLKVKELEELSKLNDIAITNREIKVKRPLFLPQRPQRILDQDKFSNIFDRKVEMIINVHEIISNKTCWC